MDNQEGVFVMPSVEKFARNAFVLECYEGGMSMNDIVFALIEAGYGRISPQRVHALVREGVEKVEKMEKVSS